MRKLSTETNFAAENILEKFLTLVRKFWTLTILQLENIRENLSHRHVLDLAIFVVWLSLDRSFLDLSTFTLLISMNVTHFCLIPDHK